MESLYGELILREGGEVEAEDVLSNFKEFLLVFYGASWTPNNEHIAQAISSMVIEQNPEDDSLPPNYEVFYISGDSSKSEFKAFYNA